MNKRLISALLLGFCLAAAPTFAKAEDAANTDEDVMIPIPGAIDYQVLLQTKEGLPPVLLLRDTATLEKLHVEQGGMLFLNVGHLCQEYSSPSGWPLLNSILQYGILGAVVGKTGVNYLHTVDLANQVDPIVFEKKKEKKHLANCDVVGTNVVLQFRQNAN